MTEWKRIIEQGFLPASFLEKKKSGCADIPMAELTWNQKWQLWCAEQFLGML